MKRYVLLLATLVVAATLLIGPGSSAFAQTDDPGAENIHGLEMDSRLYGLRGQWADYLTDEWEHKDKVVKAWFTSEDTIYIVLKKEVKSQEAELRKLLAKSYDERVWKNREGEDDLNSEQSLGFIPAYVRIKIHYQG